MNPLRHFKHHFFKAFGFKPTYEFFSHVSLNDRHHREPALSAIRCMPWLVPRSEHRPEVAHQTVSSEHGRRLCGTRGLPVQIEPRAIPVPPEVEQRLRVNHLAARMSRGAKPGIELTLRPEGRDVGSGEPDVVPEAAGRHEEVDDRLAADTTAANLERDRLS